MIPDPSSPKLKAPIDRAREALTLLIHEAGTATIRVHGITLTDLHVDLEQRVADAIADAEDAIAKPLEARLAQLEQEQATTAAIHKQELENCGAAWEDERARRNTAEDALDLQAAALGETRQALQQLQEKYDALLSRVGWVVGQFELWLVERLTFRAARPPCHTNISHGTME